MMPSPYGGYDAGTLNRLLKDPRVGEVAQEKIRAELASRGAGKSSKAIGAVLESPTARRLVSPSREVVKPAPAPLPAAGALRLVLYGPPRTKKTSNRVVFRDGKPKVLPSAAWCAWLDALRATGQLDDIEPLPDRPYRCAAIFYRHAEVGDLVGYQQGLADVLESGGVISNDEFLRSWDGTRLAKDAACPRVEVSLYPI